MSKDFSFSAWDYSVAVSISDYLVLGSHHSTQEAREKIAELIAVNRKTYAERACWLPRKETDEAFARIESLETRLSEALGELEDTWNLLALKNSEINELQYLYKRLQKVDDLLLLNANEIEKNLREELHKSLERSP